MLAGVGSDESYRTLVAATKSRIYSSNDYTGNWRVLADGLGGDNEDDCNTCGLRRFSSAQLGNYIVFTNNFDPVLAWKFGDPPSGLDLWSAHNVEDLLVIGITKARCIAEFNGFLILGNVEIEGEHKSSRIYWSDYNAPLSWIPHDQSLANFHEFGLGEQVIRVEPLGKYLMVYTDQAIYQGVAVSDPDLVFQFNTIPTDNPLRFQHSLVNNGKAHIYASDSGIYVVTASDPRPSRLEWMHKADGAIYKGVTDKILAGFNGLDPFGSVNRDRCEQFVGGYNALTEEVWFSWPTDDNTCPNMSLVLSLRYESADLVDHGFSAFAVYRPDYRPTIRDWLNQQGICQAAEADFVKEGLPSSLTFGDPPLYLWNETEDPTAPIHEDSWCARLGNSTLDDMCNVCDASPVFVMADAEDFTLKEYDPEVYFREQYVALTNTYSEEGYYTLIQSDACKWGAEEEKVIKQVLIDYDAVEQEPPSELTCEVAYGSQPSCMTWKSLGDRELKCLTALTAAQHSANRTRPDLAAKYAAFYRGRFLAYRFYTGGVGGGSCFSSSTLTMSKAQARTH